MNHNKTSLSVVIPVYNDREVLPELLDRLVPALKKIVDTIEIIIVDDGSSDDSFQVMMRLKKECPELILMKLARNFGQQNAIAAGLDHATGDIVLIMDSDLQDRPEDIPLLINAMENEQKDMAIAKWITRNDSFKKKFFSSLFFRVSKKITNLNHEPGLGVFRAIRKSALEQILCIPEKTGTILSLMYWSGIDYAVVELQRDPRFAGSTGYNIRKMLKLTADRIFSYSLFPIRIASTIGVVIGFLSFLFGLAIILRRILFENVAAGWTSTLVVLAFLFGLNFFFLGIIGEYLGRIYLETKQRPKYIISRIVKSDDKNERQ